ncbi:MAG: methyl-accepting chemotaxis protein [Candidatus Kariarchaeaceae archaeon]|jgi:methyl-accepting chemotaxis protein
MAIESGEVVLTASVLIFVTAVTWLLSGRMRIALELLILFSVAEFITIFFVSALKPDTEIEFAVTTGVPSLMILLFGLRYNQLIKDPYHQFHKNLRNQTYEKTFTSIDDEFTKKYPGELSDLIKVFNRNTQQIANLLNLLMHNESAINAESKEINLLTTVTNRGIEDSVNEIDEILQSVVMLDDSIQDILNEMRDGINEVNLKFSDINSTLNNSDRLTDQTNLIAVNAAIEAAHSGSQGENFNIVADSIQKLSGRTRETTDRLIKETGLTRDLVESKINSLQIQLEQLEDVILKIAELANNSSAFAHLQQSTGKKLANLTDSISQKSMQIQDEVNTYGL